MNIEKQISGLCKLSAYIKEFLEKRPENFNEDDEIFAGVLQKSENENSWFTPENQKIALNQWADLLNENNIKKWLSEYQTSRSPKRVGLILAGNIPLVGFHDVISVILSQHIPVIKMSSKDKTMLPFLLSKWNEFSGGNIIYEFTERLKDFDAVIATGSNNTARYLEYYFKDSLSIIRKNRTSVAVVKGDETIEELELLAEDIFRYFGLGCRNVTRLFIPQDFLIDKIFESFLNFKNVINHHKYANNYEYNRAIYLLNADQFWDNNFVMLKEDEALFSPLSVLNFTRYNDLEEVRSFINENDKNIQTIVAKAELGFDSINFGETQNPSLDTYADKVDTMKFLEVL
ncbi:MULTISPECIES: acyl-CoA reductase [unclassified Kaistella]|uniref:acyl-CoA reductase n=1 Tax=unclassified Kaistella TaxID=2762626 RepID=UPI002734D143|nr:MULTISPECIES: acyl-CoA reductase [unclassified Kaistella]MDP2455123.1 acyl-CoA reductase [Kaistella sp. SH11-4b]MDP2458030.1 acyl-CoA reductase [Kaistella sp. SH40-3]MDP2460997.1 acyl-CoA reductase [Kaistella sp. SH19-2b]